MNQLEQLFDELQSMSYDKKVDFASSLIDQIIPQMNEIYGHDATEYEVFWFFGGLASIPDVFNNYGLSTLTYDLFIDSLNHSKQINYQYDKTDDDFSYDSFRKNVFSPTRDMGSSYHVDGVFKELEDEYKIKASFFMAVMASSDGALTNDERQLVTYFFMNGSWDYDTDIWANEVKTPKVLAPIDNQNNSGDNGYTSPSTPHVTFTANNEYVSSDEGSYVVGIVLVLFLNWIGLIIAIATKKPRTIKGALIVLGISFLLIIVLIILLAIGIIPRENVFETYIESIEDQLTFYQN